MSEELKELKEKLLKSNWPKCNELAKEVASYNNEEAKNILLEVLEEGKRHHIRTAAIDSLSNFFNDSDIIENIKQSLNDPAYETRMKAKEVLQKITGEEYTTGKGE